ncbi:MULTISPECIES: efflux RND transporter periplasmic adaptor subunit [Acinetobacter]|uniref:Efflux RND transporter periplasmic adaptor subunit n=1 Tax=Acinetobacter faecalis TaxID=2665161 RepID=A0AB35UVE0_9GAMM|nr:MULTISPECIES: efflux RND transporter periplasmic adaptor subunit [Acinetobacter]NWK63878.1 efflux RND transporter periplasmic adaptor subunit [Acinetobacter sp. SwsAc3]MDH1699865.1 efflux RND transporter periplasmic adaptor subunit [Acinetobacter johnsonii]MDH1707225.1 efflux RND transporter periplasmic adaptor subunit [Acinetobacter johnsonii]MDY6487219.1 efflux RND transporter periplasmic adaptor subunit [Acinetobacter faecalis]NAR99871.1 efflux RND transporter periplasmic adaptor subunit
MLVTRYKPWIMIILLVLLVSFAIYRWWQGPLLPSYEVVSSPLIQTVVASGRVEKVSRTQIGSEITGVVLERLVQEGDRVSRGDVLLVLKSDEISAQVRQAEAELKELATTRRPQAEFDLANAKVQLEQAQREAVRRRNTELGILSAEEREKSIEAEKLARNNLESARLKVASLAPDKVEETKLREQLAALQAQLAKTKIRAEVSGIILTRNVEPGDLVQPSQTLFTIALDGATEIRVPFDERNLPLLALQQKAAVITDAYPDQPFPAHINFIAPSIDAQRGTVDVRLTVDPVPDFLRQDMTVSVNVETNKREQTLVIPNDALSSISGNKAMVILVRDRKIQRHPITLGLRGLVMSEVVAGLKEGDHVLTDAESVLKDGIRVRIEQTKRVLQSQTDPTNSKNELPVKFD